MFIQKEDEIAALAAVLGASWAGMKAMTCHLRAGLLPHDGEPGACGDDGNAVRDRGCAAGRALHRPSHPRRPRGHDAGPWGSHGHYEIIALCPASPQEAFDLTVKAFALSERFRVPVLIMTDEVVGHMYERVEIPKEVPEAPRRKPRVPPEEFLPFKP
jgi:2-oxoglutarate ferredoxin oxidoreductase subunit alpha